MRRYKYSIGSVDFFNKTDLESKINNDIINNYFSNKIKKPAEFLTAISRVKI